MKKVFALLLTMTMVLSLAACGGKKEEAPAETPETPAETPAEKPAGWWKEELSTVTDGKLTVATSPDFAPYEFYAIGEDGKPQLAGFDLALAQYIADYMGLELDVIPMDFDGVIMEVGMNNVDLGMAGLSPDPKRANQMDFSDIYYEGGQSLVAVEANADKFTTLEAANDPDVSVGAQIGSIQADLAMQNSPDANIIQLSKVTDIIAELISGKMDAAYIETVVAESYQKNYPELKIVCDVPYEVAGSAIGVMKDNEALMAGVNEAIAAALADGSMSAFIAEANELAAGETYEGLLDANGEAPAEAPAA